LLASVLVIDGNVQLSLSLVRLICAPAAHILLYKRNHLVYRNEARAFRLPCCGTGLRDCVCNRWDGNETEREWSNFALVL